MPSPPRSTKPHSEMTVDELMRETGFDRDYAEFFLAMARGETIGDVVTLPDPRRPAPRPAKRGR
jgi:hypothetical protein